jgi:hypothetical protein
MTIDEEIPKTMQKKDAQRNTLGMQQKLFLKMNMAFFNVTFVSFYLLRAHQIF